MATQCQPRSGLEPLQLREERHSHLKHEHLGGANIFSSSPKRPAGQIREGMQKSDSEQEARPLEDPWGLVITPPLTLVVLRNGA